MTTIGILGALGRMGQQIAAAAPELGADLSGGIDKTGAVHGSYDTAAALAQASDVLIDFSSPEALQTHLDAAVRAGCPIVIGTTGLTDKHHRAIDAAAAQVAVLQSANMSLGVNLLRHFVQEAAARLGPDWDVEILEMHHRHKVDAPSGTALMLGDAAAKGRGGNAEELDRLDRMSVTQAREPGTVGYASLRGGSVAGDHLVIFATDDERLELGHRAESRRIFARGAVQAALWLAGKQAGRYQMSDVLGLP
jgi:4-hydroxy-tetrahydrodipicolinate reductase